MRQWIFKPCWTGSLLWSSAIALWGCHSPKVNRVAVVHEDKSVTIGCITPIDEHVFLMPKHLLGEGANLILLEGKPLQVVLSERGYREMDQYPGFKGDFEVIELNPASQQGFGSLPALRVPKPGELIVFHRPVTRDVRSLEEFWNAPKQTIRGRVLAVSEELDLVVASLSAKESDYWNGSSGASAYSRDGRLVGMYLGSLDISNLIDDDAHKGLPVKGHVFKMPVRSD